MRSSPNGEPRTRTWQGKPSTPLNRSRVTTSITTQCAASCPKAYSPECVEYDFCERRFVDLLPRAGKKLPPRGNRITPQQNTGEKESTKEKEESAQEPSLIHPSAWKEN